MESTGFLEESPNNKSWIRLAGSFILILAAFVVVYNTIQKIPVDIVLITMLIGTALAGKVVQKISENSKND